MMERGEIWKENWMYCIAWEDEEVLTVSNNAHEAFLEASNKLSDNRIKELESDVEYLNKEYEKMDAKIKKYQAAIRNSFYYINNTLHKKIDWPTYKATIKLEGDLPWEDNQ